MELVREFFHRLFAGDLRGLIQWGGYIVLATIVFSETGLLIGFFLPGDSLLVTAGALCAVQLDGAPPVLNILYVNALLMVCAIVGDAVGYQIGLRSGPALFKREESLLFKPRHLRSTKRFYDKHGGKAIIMARFIPFARTFAPVVAGIAKMPYRRFAMFNIVGGISWVASMTLLGYFLGRMVSPKSIERVVYLIIVISVTPVALELWRNYRLKKSGQLVDEEDAPSEEAPPAAQ